VEGILAIMLGFMFLANPLVTSVSFVFGLGIGCSAPITMALMFNWSKEGRPGEALGLRLTTNNVVRVIGPSLFGLVASGFGLPAVFVLAALTMGAGGLLSRSPRRRREKA